MAYSESAFWLMAVAVTLSSVAMMIAARAWLGVYRAIRRMEEQVTPLIPQVAELLAEARKVLEDARKELGEISTARADLTGRLQAQTQRLEIVLDSSLTNIQEVVNAVHGGVVRPIREVTGWLSAIRATINALLRGQQASPEKATSDEEIFIG